MRTWYWVGGIVIGGTACWGSYSTVGTEPSSSPTVATVSVTAPSFVVAVNGTAQLTATAKDASGTPISGLPVSWSSNNAPVASVDGSGVVTGVSAGKATISATISGVVGSMDIDVAGGSPHVADVFTPGLVFQPASVTIAVGDTVRFNISGVAHNVRFDAAQGGHPANIPAVTDTSVTRVFTKAGTFDYVCELHQGMAGRVIVQ